MYKLKDKDKFVAVAIHLGKEYSYCAVSFRSKYEITPVDMIGRKLRNPTAIVFDRNKSFYSFGEHAQVHYEYILAKGDLEDWYYFINFTKFLYQQETIQNMTIKDIRDRELPVVDVFAGAINYFRSEFFQEMNSKNIPICQSEVQWVLLVPDIRNNAIKYVMTEAAIQACIEKDSLLLAPESDAAFMCCEQTYVQGMGRGPHKAGSKHLLLRVCEVTDIVVLEVRREAPVKTLESSEGNDGLEQVYKMFEQLLTAIFGDSVLRSFYQGHPEEVKCIQNYLRIKIKNLYKYQDTDWITVQIPIVLKEIFEDESDVVIEEAIARSQYIGKLQWMKDKLRIKSDIFQGLYKSAGDSTVDLIESLVQKHKPIESIMLVGEFSEAPYLQQKVREAFPDITCIIPQKPGSAALCGAAILGHTPEYSVSRVAKFTYGFAINRKFDSDIHPAEKKLIIKKRAYCKDVFETHVREGEEISPGVPQCDKIYKPCKAGQTSLEFPVFASFDKDPMFVTDESCFQVGRVEVDLPDTYCDKELLINVKMYYGDTTLTAEAQDVRTSIKFSTKCYIDYDKFV